MRKTTIEMRKNSEANALRRVAKAWARTGSCMGYKRAAVRETYRCAVNSMEDELFDGILLSLSPRNSSKSMSVQMRVLRRIAEKRQAQVAFKYIGRSEDLLTEYTMSTCAKSCMRELCKYQTCV